MSGLKLRDRDAIVTKEGLIFRVFGYTHPPNAYICDVEYAPSEIFKSNNPKALRKVGQRVFYKFYEDEGLRFVKNSFPEYLVFHDMLQMKVAGVNHSDIFKVEKPDEKLRKLMEMEPKDELAAALQEVLKLTTQCSSLSMGNFGIFGSILHDFYHPKFSDLDFIVYGRKNAVKLLEALKELYANEGSSLKNEFESENVVAKKHWRFQNFSPKEYFWHQKRKMIYAMFKDENSGRLIKTEFEPVKDWKEISNDYDANVRISRKGWVKMLARIIEDCDTPFIPSIYDVEALDVLTRATAADKVRRIVSYMEEFRMQAFKDEKVYVEGNLEEVVTSKGSFYQIVLTYCPKYYEQVLKVVS